MSRMPKEKSNNAGLLQDKSRSLRRHSNPALRVVSCCNVVHHEGRGKYPHGWYEDSGVIFKCHYCPKHEDELFQHPDQFYKTKNQLLAYLTTRKLLHEDPATPPF